MTTQTPRDAVADQSSHAQALLPAGSEEKLVLSAVMGLPFSSGHLLCLRDIYASSVGDSYRSVWHRDPSGDWTIYSTTDPERSCPRWFGAGLKRSEVVDAITVDWTGEDRCVVRMGDRLEWRMQVGRTLSTRMMTAMSRRMPARAWRNDPLLTSMGPMASLTLHSGRVRMNGSTPNDNHFRAAPTQIFRVRDSSCTLDGRDLGQPQALPTQARLGDFWLPQRGLFIIATVTFSPVANFSTVAAGATAGGQA